METTSELLSNSFRLQYLRLYSGHWIKKEDYKNQNLYVPYIGAYIHHSEEGGYHTQAPGLLPVFKPGFAQAQCQNQNLFTLNTRHYKKIVLVEPPGKVHRIKERIALDDGTTAPIRGEK